MFLGNLEEVGMSSDECLFRGVDVVYSVCNGDWLCLETVSWGNGESRKQDWLLLICKHDC